jgi:hypothetical protein
MWSAVYTRIYLGKMLANARVKSGGILKYAWYDIRTCTPLARVRCVVHLAARCVVWQRDHLLERRAGAEL